MLEVLSLVRSMKNTFASINRIPQGVLSLIPDYCNTDDELVALTHVCRGWREHFISRSSLWTSLDCARVEQTRAYLERSNASPLKIRLVGKDRTPFLSDAFLLTVPHLDRPRNLIVSGSSSNFLQLIKYFTFPAPLLEKLDLDFSRTESPVIRDLIFYGDFSSLRELRLAGVITDMGRQKLSNLTTFDLCRVPSHKISVTWLLNLFEHAPLRKIRLHDAFPRSSDAPPGRVVSLPHLKSLTIVAQPVHTILLNHMLIPTGASLTQRLNLSGNESPIHTHLPKALKNLNHVSRIASINLSFGLRLFLGLVGPSGAHHVFGDWDSPSPFPLTPDWRVLQSSTVFHISGVERLAIDQYTTPPPTRIEKSPVYQTLLLMNNLRTVALTESLDLPFVLALDPGQNPSRTVVCSRLEEIVLCIVDKDGLHVSGLLEMAKRRVSSGAKLSAITVVIPRELVSAKEVLKLREYVSRVEYRLGGVIPEWCIIPDDGDNAGYKSD